MIALTIYGKDGLQRWGMGNITERILLDTKLPLLIVPPQRHHMPIRNEQAEEMEIRK